MKTLKTSLLNIDSSFRNRIPKNITLSNRNILPLNPITTTKNSPIVTINYPNHSFSTGDNITIQNVIGISKTLINSISIYKDFQYAIIDFKNIPNLTINTPLYIQIDISGDQTCSNLFGSVPFNSLYGLKQIYLFNDILSDINPTVLASILSTLNYTQEQAQSNVYLIKLPWQPSIISENEVLESYIIPQVFKFTLQFIGGIPIGYFNANFPINYYNYQSKQTITNVIDENTFEITLPIISDNNIQGGGKNIIISKIINELTGYPDPNNYTINLKKSFNNVISVKLASTSFPYIDLCVQNNVNDKLYWKNLLDGSYTYSLKIPEGFYTPNTLLDKIQADINKVPRITSTSANTVYNIFDVTLDANTQNVSFTSYKSSALPNSLSIQSITIDNVDYYSIVIADPDSTISVGDDITISGAIDCTIKLLPISISNAQTIQQSLFGQTPIITTTTTTGTTVTTGTAATYEILNINALYINRTYQVYSINPLDSTYTVILGEKNIITTTTVTSESKGGENIQIKSYMKFSLEFDKPDTIGSILGFVNVGQKDSIFAYANTISCQDPYQQDSNLNIVNVVGNPVNWSSGFMNFSGQYNYFLMYLNDLEYIYSPNSPEPAFAKILIAGNPGDVLFNTFVQLPQTIYSKNYPITTLTDITVKFLYPDNIPVNFRNLDHDFTLEITEAHIQNTDTLLNSRDVDLIKELEKNPAKEDDIID